MAKTQNSQIKKTSQEIMKLLREGLTVNQIAKLGYSLATAKYYKRKLFDSVAYQSYLKKKRKTT